MSDVLTSHRRLEEAWVAASHEVWAEGLGVRNAGRTTVSDFVFLRWREAEVHAADLGMTDPDEPGSDPWDLLPQTYLDHELAEMTAGLAPRLPDGITASDDPLPAARSAVYARSFTRRAQEPKSPSEVNVSQVRS